MQACDVIEDNALCLLHDESWQQLYIQPSNIPAPTALDLKAADGECWHVIVELSTPHELTQPWDLIDMKFNSGKGFVGHLA